MAFIVGRMAFSRGTTTLGEQAPCAACEQIVPVIVTCVLLLWKLDLPTPLHHSPRTRKTKIESFHGSLTLKTKLWRSASLMFFMRLVLN